jgi:hypothetical protein
MPIEGGLDDAALDAPAAAVDQAHPAQPRLVCGTNVLLDHRRDVTRRERVEVDRVFDGDSMWQKNLEQSPQAEGLL